MARRALLAFATVVLTSVAACEGVGEVATGAQALPACGYAPDVVPIGSDAGGKCSAARTYLTCPGHGCLSDDPARCSGDTPDASTCTDQCHPDEYGVACSVPIVASAPLDDAGAPPSAPEGCRTVGITPGGVTFFCCPCLAH